ncbi:MAG TPA: glycosyltransferase [Solirubrobacteraceae bacterium]|nr:glycosyltransferase [Solirubrobacteraceae bacterium]
MSSSIERSNGFLPLAPLRHAGATAVGVWDMDRAGGVTPAMELPANGSPRPGSPVPGAPAPEAPAPEAPGPEPSDQLVLVRLHQQPLAILHLGVAGGAVTRDALMAAAWPAAGEAILNHITRCRCLPAAEGAGELSMLLDAAARASSDAGSAPGAARPCPGGTARRPPGKAAVILCTTGADQDQLRRSLQALAAVRDDDFGLVLVDNRPRSGSATLTLVESFVSRVRIRYVAEPLPGLARARNAGLQAAGDAAYVAFTDDDAVVDPGWLAWLLDPFYDDGVAAVTGLVMPLQLGSAAEKRFEHYAGFGKGVERAVYDLNEHAAPERFLYPYWGGMFGSGNSMAFRRDALLAVGGFDTALGAGTPTAGGEDLAAFTDVILGGGRLVYEPRSLCWHQHRGDEQALRAQIRNYGIGLTAVLWRYLMTDWRFSASVLRSLPAIARLARSRSDDRNSDRLPSDLARLELRGRLLGPWRYLQSRHRVGAAGQITGRRHQEADQAGVQTRT